MGKTNTWNRGMSTVEVTVVSAVSILLVFGLYNLLKELHALENIIVWFRNQFARGISNI